jgi:hypothetical protein
VNAQAKILQGYEPPLSIRQENVGEENRMRKRSALYSSPTIFLSGGNACKCDFFQGAS